MENIRTYGFHHIYKEEVKLMLKTDIPDSVVLHTFPQRSAMGKYNVFTHPKKLGLLITQRGVKIHH